MSIWWGSDTEFLLAITKVGLWVGNSDSHRVSLDASNGQTLD
jgi:hypothetical protein